MPSPKGQQPLLYLRFSDFCCRQPDILIQLAKILVALLGNLFEQKLIADILSRELSPQKIPDTDGTLHNRILLRTILVKLGQVDALAKCYAIILQQMDLSLLQHKL